MKKYLLLVFALVWAYFSFAQGPKTQQVFSHLVAASGNVASARPDIKMIGILPLLASPNLSPDELAILMAPYVTRHYYPNLSPDEIFTKGIYLTYMAGYDPKGRVAETWRKAYDAWGLVTGVPSLPSIQTLATAADRKLEKLVPVFEMANYLSVIGQYEMAARCYQHLLNTFPSREIYNNLAVCLSLEAYALFDTEELLFFYPFEIDTKSRLDRTKGAEDIKMRKMLMKKARQYFKTAMLLDKSYATGLVNYASIVCMIGDYDEAITYAKQGFSKASPDQPQTRSNALMVQAIALYMKEKKDLAKGLFAQAAELAGEEENSLAKINREIAETGIKPTNISNKPIIDGSIIEILDGMDLEDYSTNLKSGIADEPDYQILTLEDDILAGYPVPEGHSSILVYCRPVKGDRHDAYAIHMTGRNCQESSARGINLGDFIDEVVEKYGEPTMIRSSRQGKLLYYQEAGILFFFDTYDDVRAWGVTNVCDDCK